MPKLNFEYSKTPSPQSNSPEFLVSKRVQKPEKRSISINTFRSLSPQAALALKHQKLSPKTADLFSIPISPQTGFNFPLTVQQALVDWSNFLTFNQIQELKSYTYVYYIGQKSSKATQYSDREGHFVPVVGDQIAFRYEIIEEMGTGNFGKVLRCFDHKRSRMVAVKVLKTDRKIQRSGYQQIQTLQKLNQLDPKDEQAVVKLKNYFQFRTHLCLVFDILGKNLYEYIEENPEGIQNLNLLRRIATQIIRGLKFIHLNGIIHADLKPENILLKDAYKSNVKIIDLGSSVTKGDCFYDYIQSRFYRAPEIVLGKQYDTPIDMWSLGCILYELYTGQVLFEASSQEVLMEKVVQTIGEPTNFVLKGCKRKFLFQSTFSNRSLESFPLRNKLESNDMDFIDFLQSLVKWDPNQRLTAQGALLHPWIQGKKVASLESIPAKSSRDSSSPRQLQ